MNILNNINTIENMETKYKLKKEARQFFDNRWAKEIYPLESWRKKNIHENLLQEVEKTYIKLGHVHGNGTSLNGWDSSKNNGEAHFHFTIHATDIDHKSYESVDIGQLMDEIQKVTNKYFKHL